jgi:hypothetical protein
MAVKQYTTEELLERWEDIHAIENLMGRRAFFKLLVRDQKVFVERWTKNDPCFGINDGYYKGYEAVAGYFQGLRDLAIHRAEFAKMYYREELGSRNVDDIIGVGALHVNNLTTPVIELAGDRRTAKGIWYVMDGEVDFGVTGWETCMSWGRLGVDFIKEEDGWKIWHMVYAEDINTPMGVSWAEPCPQAEPHPFFGMLAGVKIPEPSVKVKIHELWHEKRPLKPFPPVPEPYETFDETFSYGV